MKRLLATAAVALGLALPTVAAADYTSYQRYGPGTANEYFAALAAVHYYGGAVPCPRYFQKLSWYPLSQRNPQVVGVWIGSSCTIIFNYDDRFTWGDYCQDMVNVWGQLIHRPIPARPLAVCSSPAPQGGYR